MGRGRPPPGRQNQRAAGNERRTVSIEGLSSSTTDMQLRNLLRSIGPIEVGRQHRNRNNALSSVRSYSALCWRDNPQPVVLSATDVLHVPPAEESRRQILQSRARCKLPDELPQVVIAFNNLGMESGCHADGVSETFTITTQAHD